MQDLISLTNTCKNLIKTLETSSNSLQSIIDTHPEKTPNSDKKEHVNRLSEIRELQNELRLTKIDLMQSEITLNEIIAQKSPSAKDILIVEWISKKVTLAEGMVARATTIVRELGLDISKKKSGEKTEESKHADDFDDIEIIFWDDEPNVPEGNNKKKDRENTTNVSGQIEEQHTESLEDKDAHARSSDARDAIQVGGYLGLLLERAKGAIKKGDECGYREAVKINLQVLENSKGKIEDTTFIIDEIERLYESIEALYDEEYNRIRISFERANFLYEMADFEKAEKIFVDISDSPDWRDRSKAMIQKCKAAQKQN